MISLNKTQLVKFFSYAFLLTLLLPEPASSAVYPEIEYWEAEKIGVIIYPESRLLSRPEKNAGIIHRPDLWEVVFVLKTGRNAWKNVPVENERERLICKRVVLPSGQTGWIEEAHILQLDTQFIGGKIAKDNTSLYNQLPNGKEIGKKKANTRFQINNIKLEKIEETISLFYDVGFRRDYSDQSRIYQAWVREKDIHLAYHEALINAGLKLMQQWESWKEEHFIGGAELLYKHILEEYPNELYFDWEYGTSEKGSLCGILALDSLADIYVISKKYGEAISYLNKIIEDYAGITGTIGKAMNEWAAEGPADGLARLKIASIYDEYLKDHLKALSIYQEIISKHGGQEIWGFEWNTILGIEALDRIENIGERENLPEVFMAKQFHQAVLNNESAFTRLLGTIKKAQYQRKTGNSSQAAADLLEMIHKHPSASMMFFKTTADYSVSALDLLCQIHALDLMDPQKARELCQSIYLQYKDIEGNHLDGAALYLKAETLDLTDGTREAVINEYSECISLFKDENVISVIRNFDGYTNSIGAYAAQERIKAMEAYEPLSKKADEKISIFFYPDKKAKVIHAADKGDLMTVMYKKEDAWYKVSFQNGIIGWAEKSQVDPPIPPSSSYSDWTISGGNELQWRSIERNNTIDHPDVKLVMENIAAKEIIFFDANKDNIPDLVIAGMNDRERETSADYHNIMVINGKTGETIWKLESNDRFSFSPPAVYESTLYVFSDFGQVFALDIYTGNPKWTYQLDSGIQTMPVAAGGLLIAGSQTSELHVLSREDGTLIKKIKMDHHIHMSNPAYENEKFYCSASGKYPLVNVKDQGAFICLDAKTFETLWIHPLETKYVKSSPVITENLLIAGAGDGCIYALDKQSGDLKWTYKTKGPITSSPAFQKEIICAGSEDGIFYAFRSNSGELLWTFETSDKFTASPCIVGNVVYAGSNDGCLYALHLADGKLLWKYPIGTRILKNISSNGPVIAVLADYQKLYLIGEK